MFRVKFPVIVVHVATSLVNKDEYKNSQHVGDVVRSDAGPALIAPGHAHPALAYQSSSWQIKGAVLIVRRRSASRGVAVVIVVLIKWSGSIDQRPQTDIVPRYSLRVATSAHHSLVVDERAELFNLIRHVDTETVQDKLN